MINEKTFRVLLILIAGVFVGIFGVVVVPPLLQHPDIPGAFLAGFVNPYASGYASDVIACWGILAVWVLREWKQVKYGWCCLLLGIIPGVAVGFAAYLWLRSRQLQQGEADFKPS